MGTILTEAEGFTPLIDVLVQELGLLPAVVYGRVWRYCQGSRGVCQASLATIADEIGLSRKSVQRYIKDLCGKGYLEDDTPDLRNVPHTYRDTGKAQIRALVSAKVAIDLESNQTDAPMDTESMPVGQRVHSYGHRVHAGRTESPMKIQEDTIKINNNKTTFPFAEREKESMPNGISANADATGVKATANVGEEENPADTVRPDTPGSAALFAKVNATRSAQGRRLAKRFGNLAQKRKFVVAEQRLGEGLEMAIDVAMGNGVTTLAGLVNWLAKYEDNGRGRRPSKHPRGPQSWTRDDGTVMMPVSGSNGR